MTDYRSLYDSYWMRDDRWGSHSFTDPDLIVDQILTTCGSGKILDVGCGMGLLVRTFLRRGIDASGIDIARKPVDDANRFAPGRFRVGSILDIREKDEAFETVISTDCLEHLDPSDVTKALAELYRVTKQFLYLRIATKPDRDNTWHLTIQNREWWEKKLFESGFRKHTLFQAIVPYESLEHQETMVTILMEKINPSILKEYSLDSLKAERDLHMDMLRESGRRSDAHIARYILASRFVRRNDVVLDAACGLGYGSAILFDGSQASKVIGIDESAYAVDYAQSNFSEYRPGIEFLQNDVTSLSRYPEHSVDLVVSFETIEHLKQPDEFLKEAKRVLKPGGRFICSVPNKWIDESGKDPNPYHHHVFDRKKLQSLLEQYFIPEQLFSQTAGGGMVFADQPRALNEVDIRENAEVPAEWWLMIGMKDPVSTSQYRETVYAPADSSPSKHPHKYTTSYKYPWIQHSMVVPGLRAHTRSALNELLNRFSNVASQGSTEQGAVLCVNAYQILGDGPTCETADDIMKGLDAYIFSSGKTPMHIRWKISCAYVLAQLQMAMGQFEKAEAALRQCVVFDFMDFSPALATKTVHAWIQLGRLTLQRNDGGSAAQAFQNAIDEASRAIRSPWLDWSIDTKEPGVEIILEASDVLNLAAEAAVALRGVHGKTLFEKTLTSTSDRHTRAGLTAELKSLNRWYKTQIEEMRAEKDILGKTANEREKYAMDLREHLERSWQYAKSLETKVNELEQLKTGQ